MKRQWPGDELADFYRESPKGSRVESASDRCPTYRFCSVTGATPTTRTSSPASARESSNAPSPIFSRQGGCVQPGPRSIEATRGAKVFCKRLSQECSLPTVLFARG